MNQLLEIIQVHVHVQYETNKFVHVQQQFLFSVTASKVYCISVLR